MSIIPKYLLNRRGSGGGGGINPNSLKTVGYDSLIKDPQMPVGNVEFGFQQNAQGYPGGYLYVGQQHVSLRTINGQQLVGNTDIQITGEPNMVSTTWAALKALRDGNTLVPGTWYRITDYTCTTNQSGTDSAGHDFDIIVRADASGVLNENAFAALHGTDKYFELCNLSAWQLKYCIDNDDNRFSWADKDTGKGVVYWMRDEFGNEAPYDFKNIRFARWAISDISDNKLTPDELAALKSLFVYDESINPIYFGLKDADYSAGGMRFTINDKLEAAYYYTFGGDTDQSIDGYENECYSNKVKSCIKRDVQVLNNGVFVKNANAFQNNSITCGSNCHDWTCGSNCSGWTCGNECSNWTCGKECNNWTCGSKCSGWNCGSNCNSWTCGNECSNWTCGNNCSNWTCGNECSDWSCGNECSNWSCGNNCSNWTCSNYYDSWTCGNDCSFWYDQTSGSSSATISKFHLMSGTSGTRQSPLGLSSLLGANVNFSKYVGFDSHGTLKAWVPANLAQ